MQTQGQLLMQAAAAAGAPNAWQPKRRPHTAAPGATAQAPAPVHLQQSAQPPNQWQQLRPQLQQHQPQYQPQYQPLYQHQQQSPARHKHRGRGGRTPSPHGGRGFHSQAHAFDASSGAQPRRNNSAKRRKLPHFLSPEELDAEAAEAALMASQMPAPRPPMRSPSAPQHHQHQQQHHALSARSHSASTSQHAHAHRVAHPKVSYLLAPARCELPPNFSVSYAQNRAQSLVHAKELHDLLLAELDDRAAPATTQHASSDASCECPIVLGLDCEWRPSFVKGQPQNPVALLQLSTSTRAYLFQIINWALPRRLPPSASLAEHKEAQHAAAIQSLGPSLSAILLDPRILKAGIGVKGDIAKFFTDYNLMVQGMLDLSDYANERLDSPQPPAVDTTVPASASAPAPAPATPPTTKIDRRCWSLAALVSHTLDGVELAKPKSVRMSNWELQLSANQQRYAALDAYVSWAVFDRLHQTHVQQRNCTRAMAVGMGHIKRPKSPHFVPIEVVVRRTNSNSSASPSVSSTSTSAAATSSASPPSLPSPSPPVPMAISRGSSEAIDLTSDSESPRKPSRPASAAASRAKRDRSFEIIDE